MELINNRYRIIEVLEQKYHAASYLAADVMNSHQLLCVNILNLENISEGTINVLKEEFIRIRNANTSGIVQVLQFGIVTDIDGHKLDRTEYYYTTEYIERNGDIHQLAEELEDEKKLDLAAELCCIINTLHLKGTIYEVIRPENIYYTKNNGEIKLKLRDLLTLEIEKISIWKSGMREPVYRAPELLRGASGTRASDIYSLGMLFLKFFGQHRYKKDTARKKFYGIIEKMVERNPEKRYTDINSIIDDINKKLDKNYKSFVLEDLEKVNLNIKLTGMDFAKYEVMKAFNAVNNGESGIRIIGLHGETGVGKSRLLKELEYTLQMSKGRVYSSYNERGIIDSDRVPLDILKKIISDCPEKILNKYKAELIQFIPQLVDNMQTTEVSPLIGEKDRYRLINRLSSFIGDFVKEIPAVILIDNLHFENSFFIELIESMYSNNLERILLIFTYNDAEYGANNEFNNMLSIFKDKETYLGIKVNPLTEEETVDMVKNILCAPKSLANFTKLIYSQTYGNPLFVEEVIKKLFLKRDIYIDKKTGVWSTDYSMKDIPIPASLEQAMVNQMKELDKYSVVILETISVFNSALSLETISLVLRCDVKDIKVVIDNLVEKGIISQKINDKGFVFDFYNKVLKRLIYGGIEAVARRDMHKLVAKVIEESFDAEDGESREELIYHLEMAGIKDKVIKYCIENADRFAKLNIVEAVVKNINKAIAMFDESKKEPQMVELYIRLGDVYKEQGDIKRTLDNYEKAEQIAQELREYKLQIDALCKIAFLFYNTNDIDQGAEFIAKVEKILLGIEYPAGMIRVKLFWSQVNILKQSFDRALSLCDEGMELCTDEYPKLKGKLLTIRGKIYYESGNVEVAMISYEESLKYCKRVGYTKGTLRSLNNIAVINMDNYQNYSKAIEYLMELKEVAEKGNFPESEIIAYMNIGEINFINWKYEDALGWYMKALEKAEKYYFESEIFYSYVILTNIYLLMCDYNNAYKYFKLATEELLNHPDQGRGLADYYRIGAAIFNEFGEIEKGRVFAENALEMYENEESVLKWSCEIIKLFMELKDTSAKEQAEVILKEIYEILAKFVGYEIRANMIYNALLILEEKGLMDLGQAILGEFDKDLSEPRIQLKKLLLMSHWMKGPEKLNTLNEALDMAVKSKDKVNHWKICCAIGDFYLEKQKFFYAVNFYFDACEIVRELVLSVPENSRIGFLHSHDMQDPFYKLFQIRKHYYKTGLNPQKVINEKELEQLFEYVDLRDILTNKHFIRSAQKIYDSAFGNKIKTIGDIFGSIYSDSLKTLDTLIIFLARITLAKQAFILSEEQGREIKILAGASGQLIDLESRYIIEKARSSKSPILVTERNISYSGNDIELLPTEVKAAICIPIIMTKETDQEVEENLRTAITSNSYITGYIYLESDKILNNFNEETFKMCKRLSSFIGFIIEKYQLKLTSSIDKLTGTLTRKFLEDALAEQVEVAAVNHQSFSIIIFDIDNFKGVNDKFGHQTGDQVLSKVCGIVLDNIRRLDSCGRYGGEEFIIILPETELEGASIVAEKLRRTIEQKRLLGDKREVTVSMGIAAYPQHGETSHELIEKADQALYVAKDSGRNRSQVWQQEFSGKVKGTNKLTGIITGNAVKDHRNVAVMLELMELVKREAPQEQNIYEMLGRIIEITEAQQGILFEVNAGVIRKRHGRKMFQEAWSTSSIYNKSIVESVLQSKQGVCLIDWDEIVEYDSITGMPDWKSVVVTPMIKNGEVKGILYLSVSTRMKEFRLDDFNFINALGQIAVALL